jgi:glycine oxidase
LIIGSGLIGRLLAWRLIQAGHAVDILSKDDVVGTDSAGYVAAAMISPATEAVHTEAMVKTIGLASLSMWPKWLAELPDPVFYQRNGTLVVAHAGDATELSRFMIRAKHVLDNADYQSLDQQQLNDYAPDLAIHFDQAMYFPDEACLDNRQLYRVLADALSNTKQCRWLQCEAIESLSTDVIEQLSQRYFNHRASEYAETLDCRGNGAKQDITDLRSVRGEIIRVHAPEVDLKHVVRLMHPRYPLYLAPRANNEYVLGATVIESDDMSPVSVRSGMELMSALYSIHKGFAEARVLEMAAHCRPTTMNNMPMIKRTGWGYQVNGFYRHGYLFAPAILSDLLAMLAGQASAMIFNDYFDV